MLTFNHQAHFHMPQNFNDYVMKFLTHESSRVVGIGTDFTVDFDQPLHDNFSDLRVVESILKTISQENHHG